MKRIALTGAGLLLAACASQPGPDTVQLFDYRGQPCLETQLERNHARCATKAEWRLWQLANGENQRFARASGMSNLATDPGEPASE